MIDWFIRLFDASDFLRRWACGQWHPAHVYTDIGADCTIAAAYFSIPVAIAVFVVAIGSAVPDRSRWVPWAFVVFVSLCGLTHVANVLPFRWPAYRLFTTLKVVTAGVSLVTAIALWPTVLWARRFVLDALTAHRERDAYVARLQDHIARLEATAEVKRARGSDEHDIIREVEALRTLLHSPVGDPA